MKIYNVNKISDDEYIAGLDSSWETIDLAYKACDLQNKQYSAILKAEVYEMELYGPEHWKDYEHNVIHNEINFKSRNKIKDKQKPKDKKIAVL